MSSRKHLYEEFSALEATSPTKKAKIHGVVTSISPMQSGKSDYFEGQLSDETSTVRMVRFKAAQQAQLSAYHEQQDSITLENCVSKKAQWELYGSHTQSIHCTFAITQKDCCTCWLPSHYC